MRLNIEFIKINKASLLLGALFIIKKIYRFVTFTPLFSYNTIARKSIKLNILDETT